MAVKGPENNIFIFNKSMQPDAAIEKLKKQAEKMDPVEIEMIKNSNNVLWLIRESSTKAGMLTISAIQWNKEKKIWDSFHQRVGFNGKTWIVTNNPDEIPSMTAMNAENLKQNAQSLTQCFVEIKTINNNPMIIDVRYRTNPKSNEFTQNELYTHYTPPFELNENTLNQQPKHFLTQSNSNQTPKVKVPLTPAINQAITCNLTGNTFKDPVVFVGKDFTTKTSQGSYRVRQGETYEKSALIEALTSSGIPQHQVQNFFYNNIRLKQAVNRLGAFQNQQKMESTQDDILVDPVSYDMFENPLIIPSGHSYSQSTIKSMIDSNRTLKCPLTQTPFKKEKCIPNHNLAAFTKAWMEYKQLLGENQAPKPNIPRG